MSDPRPTEPEHGGGFRSRARVSAERLTALFGAGVLVLNYPLLELFSHQGRLWGIPVLYLYLLLAWATLITGIGLLARRGRSGPREPLG